MVDMVNHLDYLDDVVVRMKEKLKARSIKHPEQDALTLTEAIGHLVCEIGEMFHLNAEDEQTIARILFASPEIDKAEGVDVANMSWIIMWILDHPEEAHKRMPRQTNQLVKSASSEGGSAEERSRKVEVGGRSAKREATAGAYGKGV